MNAIRMSCLVVLASAVPALLGGCSLEAAMSTCAQCGEIRSIAPRPLTPEIRLVTDAPSARSEPLDRSDVPVVYDVRVHMDRGGSRDFVLAIRPNVHVGDRVEVRDGTLMPLHSTSSDDWT